MPQHVWPNLKGYHLPDALSPHAVKAGAGHHAAGRGGDNIHTDAGGLLQHGAQWSRNRQHPVRRLAFQLHAGIGLVSVREGDSPRHHQAGGPDIRPLQAKSFFLAKPAIQAQRAENAGSGVGDALHQGARFLRRQILFSGGACVRCGFNAVCGVAQDQVVEPGCFKQLAHGQQDFVLGALRLGGYAAHNSPDMYGADVLQFHAAQYRHDMLVVMKQTCFHAA